MSLIRLRNDEEIDLVQAQMLLNVSSTVAAFETLDEMLSVLVDMTTDAVGADRSLIRFVADRPGHDRRYSLDSSKMKSLGWEPTVDLEEGMRRTVEWYKNNRAWWERIKSGEFARYYREYYGKRLAESTCLEEER